LNETLPTAEQRATCKRYGLSPVPSAPDLKVGLARNVREGGWPLNGLRHEPVGDTTGWYVWAGAELSDDPSFFEAVHVRHLAEIRPEILRFLALPPGWRFLAAPGYEDVWEDEALLEMG